MHSTVRRVCLTGFGPFHQYDENPSWLAVKRLRDEVLSFKDGSNAQITAIKIPVVYQEVLDTVPRLHEKPLSLPSDVQDGDRGIAEPFSLIVHVGVGAKGPLKFETLAHKSGYVSPDVRGAYAGIIQQDKHSAVARGFSGMRYTALDESLVTHVNVPAIVNKLNAQAVNIVQSFDPGRYLCDFIYYCSLAESKLSSRRTPTIFIHCPPVGEPLSTEEVADGLRKIILETLTSLYSVPSRL
ncbi:peptidase C15, pyroglutamyl peptidase I-like protein [Cylindrobasidium torrendii FP15055 ss-10]|uniref:Peptidase C15, pyroglutamyl peptidase I-like protein n=1 Tax=Cylindrobasidium torrendii FP15055 ss-10 TaxID=1314674 RepID=A0A0D7BJY9_9AGAR|nr:peptidase C15, pyroglutamyl peptidase I-like protein [Cylindrobasidium torrendii FP15055 ss-10]